MEVSQLCDYQIYSHVKKKKSDGFSQSNWDISRLCFLKYNSVSSEQRNLVEDRKQYRVFGCDVQRRVNPSLQTAQTHRSMVSRGGDLLVFVCLYLHCSVSSLMNSSPFGRGSTPPSSHPSYRSHSQNTFCYWWIHKQSKMNSVSKPDIALLITSVLFPQAAPVTRHGSEENTVSKSNSLHLQWIGGNSSQFFWNWSTYNLPEVKLCSAK